MQAEQICALFGTVEAVIRVIRRGQVYELLYTADTTGVYAADNLDAALLGVYKASIELLAESDTLFSQGMAKQTLRAVLRPKHAEGLTADLFKAEQKLAHEAQACEGMRNAKTGRKLDSRVKNLEDLLRPLDPLLTRTDTGVSKVLKKIEGAEYDSLVQFISPVPFRDVLDTVKRTRKPGTGEWLLAHESFQEWERVPSSSTLLWLEGNCTSPQLPRRSVAAVFEFATDRNQPALERHSSHPRLSSTWT